MLPPATRAASSSAASSSWAAGPQMSRERSSSTVSTKCPARRSASSTVSSPRSGSHHQVWGACAIRCGSKVHTRAPVWAARRAAVAAQASDLFEVTTTAPGAASVGGTT